MNAVRHENNLDMAGHTKAFIYPVMDHLGEAKCYGTRHIRTADLSVHSRTRQPPDHIDQATCRPSLGGVVLGSRSWR